MKISSLCRAIAFLTLFSVSLSNDAWAVVLPDAVRMDVSAIIQDLYNKRDFVRHTKKDLERMMLEAFEKLPKTPSSWQGEISNILASVVLLATDNPEKAPGICAKVLRNRTWHVDGLSLWDDFKSSADEILSRFVTMRCVYPVVPKYRLEGIDQGITQRCFGTSVATSYEHSFAALGMPVRLSLQHMQMSYYFNNFPPEGWSKIKMNFGQHDLSFFRRNGYLLPYYFWPEDFEFVDETKFDFKKNDATLLASMPLHLESEFKCIMGTTVKLLSYRMGRPDNTYVEILKSYIKESAAITFFITGEYLHLFNHKTGLIDYDLIADSTQLALMNLDHSLAVVGFDDELYRGTGALIVKNTWDIRPAMEVLSEPFTEKENQDFLQFRSKINPEKQHCIGYYAIPYEVVYKGVEMSAEIEQPDTPVPVLHPAPPYLEFYEKYIEHEKDHPVFLAPFACESSQISDLLLNFKRDTIYSSLEELDRAQRRNDLIDLQVRHPKVALFNLAKLSSEEDLINFYGQKEIYREFYCSGGNIFPRLEQIKDTPFFTKIRERNWRRSDLRFWIQFYSHLAQFV